MDDKPVCRPESIASPQASPLRQLMSRSSGQRYAPLRSLRQAQEDVSRDVT